jgi:DNA-binding CsgD family transcriptional regulator
MDTVYNKSNFELKTSEMIHKKFILTQEFDHDTLDYNYFEPHKSLLSELDQLGYQFHWMFDYAKLCFFYMTENTNVFPNREYAFVPGMGYQCLVDNSHPDDVLYMLNIQKAALDFLLKQKADKRLNYKFLYKMRVLTKSGDYIPFSFQIKATAFDDKGNLWLSIAQGAPSQTDRFFKPLIISTISGDFAFVPDIKHSKMDYTMPKFTEREIQMINLLAKNKSIDEICSILQITTSTFKFHRKNFLKKLNAPNSYIAIENARLLGLIND